MKRWWLIGLIIAIFLVMLSPLASASPDGLERVAQNEGFAELAEDAPFSVIADYLFPGIDNPAIATILGGLVGVAAVFGASYALSLIFKKKA